MPKKTGGGSTVVANGPWLDFEANGKGPGAVLDLAAGARLDIRIHARGMGAEILTLVGPDSIVAEGDADSELRLETRVEEPTWISPSGTCRPHHGKGKIPLVTQPRRRRVLRTSP